MTEENQKDPISSRINILKMHLPVPKHDVLVIILKKSEQCFHFDAYTKLLILPLSNSILTSNKNIKCYVTTK